MDKPRVKQTLDGRVVPVSDGLENVVSKMGTSRDKRSHNRFTYEGVAGNWPELEAAYSNNWIARSIVNLPVDDGLREWRSWQCEEAGDISDEEKRLKLVASYREAKYWARLYGGSVIIMITDQPLDKPMDVEKIGKGSLKRLVVLDRWDIQPQTINYINPIAENYLKPEWYTVVGGQTPIHHTHLIRLEGDPLPRRLRQTNEGWGDSTLRKVLEDVKDTEATKSGVAALVLESNVDVIKRDGLSSELASGQDENITKRYGLAAQMKSIVNMMLLDGTEEYERKQIAFSGLPQVMEQFMVWVSGAADIPMTRLFGRSPGGLNSTGEGDLANYYDSIRAGQENEMRPELEPLDEVLVRSAVGYMPDGCNYEWSPLYQESGTELAQQELARAQSEGLRMEQGVLKRSHVAMSIKERGEYAVTDEDVEALQDQEKEDENGAFDPDGGEVDFTGESGADEPDGGAEEEAQTGQADET